MRNNGRRDWRGIKDISMIQTGEVAGNHQDKSQQYIIGSESPISMPFLGNLKLYNILLSTSLIVLSKYFFQR